MTLLTIFWILIGISFVILAIISFGIKKNLLTPIFWILFGVSLMILAIILWHAIKGS